MTKIGGNVATGLPDLSKPSRTTLKLRKTKFLKVNVFEHVDSKNVVFLRDMVVLDGLERSGRPVATFPPILVPRSLHGANLWETKKMVFRKKYLNSFFLFFALWTPDFLILDLKFGFYVKFPP